MKSVLTTLIALTGSVALTAASPQSPPAAAGTDLYHVMFVKAAPGQAAELGKSLMTPDKTSPMPEHFIVLRHQEGDDWDYVVVEHLGPKAEVVATPSPQAVAARPLLERALRTAEATVGPDHPTVATALSNLALALRELGQAGAAQPLLERALTIDEAVRALLAGSGLFLRSTEDGEKVRIAGMVAAGLCFFGDCELPVWLRGVILAHAGASFLYLTYRLTKGTEVVYSRPHGS